MNRRDFIRSSSMVAAGASTGLLSRAVASASFPAKKDTLLKVKRIGRLISLDCPLSGKVSSVEVRILSNANNTIFEYDDISPHAPKVDNEHTRGVWMPSYDKSTEARRRSSREQRFPVVDLVLKQGMEAVIVMNVNEPGEYSFNDYGTKPVSKEIRIPGEQLEHWGNRLYLNPKTNSIQTFYIASKVNAVDSSVSFEFDTLRDDWVGSISVHDVDTRELIARTAIAWDRKLPQISTGSGVTRQRMIRSLSWATKYILGCQNTNPDSETYGGEFLLYDLSAKTRLRPDWCWAWGASARMLLNASTIKGVDAGVSAHQLLRRAVDLGHATLRQQILDPSHPAYGVLRTSRSVASTVDTLFLVGWGWMPLYKATGDRRYLEAGEKVADAAKRLMDEYEDIMIPQSFNLKKKTWADMMSFESSMGLPGLAALYQVTGKETYRETMIRLADLLIKAFEQEDGLWRVFFQEKTRQASPVNYWTKALGYCVDGLIEAHQAAPDRGYLQKAIRITEHVMNAQASDGSWTVRFDRSAEYVGICDKSTALWAGLMIRLYKMTGEKAYLSAGTQSIEWCMDHQYFGDDPVARGALVARNWASGITFRHWWDVVVTYSVTFFGDALAQALSLDEWKE
jgi:hypothetical protein